MNKDREIYKIITDDNLIPVLAKEIVDAFASEANEDNIDYSFTVDRRTGQIKGDASNTYFFFDPKENTALWRLKTAMFSEDLNDISQNSLEEKELMEDSRMFLRKVCTYATKNYIDILRETVRRVVLGNKTDEKMAPLHTIEMVSVDVADYSSVPEDSRYLVKVGKATDTEIDTDKILQFLTDASEKTGQKYQDIIDIEKMAGNNLFKNVITIQRGRKYLNEISIYFFVDYSLGPEAI